MATKKITRDCCGSIRITLDTEIHIEHLDMPGLTVALKKTAFGQAGNPEDCMQIAEKALADAGIFLSLDEHAEIGKTIFALLNE